MTIDQCNGRWRIRQTVDRKSYCLYIDHKPGKREAEDLIKDLIAERRPKSRNVMTFEEAAADYVRLKENVLSESSKYEYGHAAGRLSLWFREKRVRDITALDVQKEINDYAATHTPKSVRNIHGFISVILNTYAPGLALCTTLPASKKTEPYIPTDEDVKSILEAARGTEYEIPIMLACFGLRRSEICALTLDDFGTDSVRIDKALVIGPDRQWHVKATKTTDSTREIYLPPELIEKIREHGCVYQGHPNSITKFLSRQQDAAGVPRFGLHKFRHYYASVSHALGVPDAYIMRAGGWKTDNVMKTVYRHALVDRQRQHEEISAAHLQKIFG